MDDYTFWALIVVITTIVYLFMKYGKLQFAAGQAIGFQKGKLEGQIFGCKDAFDFLEGLGLLNLETLADDLDAGKYDHIGKIAESRAWVGKLLGGLKLPK